LINDFRGTHFSDLATIRKAPELEQKTKHVKNDKNCQGVDAISCTIKNYCIIMIPHLTVGALQKFKKQMRRCTRMTICLYSLFNV
jgi:hypothetical protein